MPPAVASITAKDKEEQQGKMNIEILIFQALKNIEGECTQAFNCRLVKMLEMNMPNLLGTKEIYC